MEKLKLSDQGFLGESSSSLNYVLQENDCDDREHNVTMMHFFTSDGTCDLSFGNGTTVLIIPTKDGYYVIRDGRLTRGKSISRSDGEKCMEIKSKTFIVHGGNARVNKLIKDTIGQLEKEDTLFSYAKLAQSTYETHKENNSCCYIFGFKQNGAHDIYYARRNACDKAPAMPYYLIGGGINCAKPFLERMCSKGHLLHTKTFPSEDKAQLAAELLLTHVSLLSECTGGRITHFHVPWIGPSHTIVTSDLELYIKHFESFEEINQKSMLVMLQRPAPPYQDIERIHIRRILGFIYFGVKVSDEAAQKQLEMTIPVDEFYTPSLKLPVKLFLVRCVDKKMVKTILLNNCHSSTKNPLVAGVKSVEVQGFSFCIGPCEKTILQQFMNLIGKKEK